MLVDSHKAEKVGHLDPSILPLGEYRRRILDFIAAQLPIWRDNHNRQPAVAETKLTEYLCDHLNCAARLSKAWSNIQFRTETADETHPGRTIDLTPKPAVEEFIVENRRHTCFDSLFPIECKRLPTPKNNARDEREYVISEKSTTGGIHRFKCGYHGATHKFLAMIAYIQKETSSHWHIQVNRWIMELANVPNQGWAESDCLTVEHDDQAAGVTKLYSKHLRSGGLPECQLYHLWIRMN